MSSLSNERLSSFVHASFGLSRAAEAPSEAQISAHRGLMMCDRLSVGNITIFASYLDKKARLRLADDVDAGQPAGTNPVEASLQQLLSLANARIVTARELASLFQLTRPFTTANGRCARALWLWRMVRGSEADRRSLQSSLPSEVFGGTESGSAFRRVA